MTTVACLDYGVLSIMLQSKRVCRHLHTTIFEQDLQNECIKSRFFLQVRIQVLTNIKCAYAIQLFSNWALSVERGYYTAI